MNSRITTTPTRLEERHDSVGDERVECLDVVRDAADHDAGTDARVEAERERLQVAEQLHAQVLQRALADPTGQVRLRGGCRPRDDRGEHEQDHDAVERRGVVLLDALVDRARRERDRRERGPSREDQRQEHQRDPALVGTQQLDQAAHLAPAPACLAQPAAQLGEAVVLVSCRRERAERAGAEGADALVEAPGGRAAGIGRGRCATRRRAARGAGQCRRPRSVAVTAIPAASRWLRLLDRLAREEDLVRQPLLDDLAVEALLR
jgi:hypothetical protein